MRANPFRLLVLFAVLVSGVAFSAGTGGVTPFQPAVTLFGPAASVYRANVGTSSTAFQLPVIGNPNPYPTVQVTLTNEGTNTVYFVVGPTAASVATVTVASPGSGTIGAAGNARPLFQGNSVVWTFPDGYWFNMITTTGNAIVNIEAGSGN